MSMTVMKHGGSWAGRGVALMFAAVLTAAPAVLLASVPLRVNRVLHVAATGSPIQNCQALRAALKPLTEGETAWRGYVVLLEPGTYFCGSEPVAVPIGVSLVGLAGRDRTLINGILDNKFVGILHMYSYTQLRGVTVQNLAVPGDGSIAVSAWRVGWIATGIPFHEVRLIGGQGKAGGWAFFGSGATVSSFDAILEPIVRLEDSSQMDIHYSLLEGTEPVSNSTAICRFSRNAAGGRFGLNCTPPEP